jgi:hypothetical protein
MKTEELINMLATGLQPVDRHAAARRYGIAIACGTVGAGLLMALFLGFNPALRAELQLPLFWVKVLFAAFVVAASLFAVVRLSRPGAPVAALPVALAAPVLAIWVLAAVALIAAQPEERIALLLGQTWRSCPFLIAALSVPAFFSSLWAMRGLAPTRPHVAGAAAGLLAGALATLVYTMHCPELAAPFVGTWYVLGMLIPTAAGALVGPYWLRW